MTVTTRRRVTRIVLAIDLGCTTAIVIRASLAGFHSWALGFTGFAALLVSVLGGLYYLHTSRGRS